MYVRSLWAERFRNLRRLELEPHPRFTVLYGDNGQGKTNILEALYLLATLRSFRTSPPGAVDDLIQMGERKATVGAWVERLGVERCLRVEMSREGPGRKQVQIDGKTARSGAFFGGFNAVLFCPDDLRLPKGPPAQRRRFLDRAVWNTRPTYLREVQAYERILRSRNALLRGEGRTGCSSQMLEVYDEQLAAAGAVLVGRRVAYLQDLAGGFHAAFARVSRSGLSAEVRYHASVPLPVEQGETAVQQIAAQLRQRLLDDRRRDLQRGFTHSGPHADDLEFFLGGQPAAAFASQGQLRALVLALKIAEICHLHTVLGDPPVLLLDDVSSELDPRRNAYLFEFLQEISCQGFITTTSPRYILLDAAERRDFQVHAGEATLANHVL
ncbi:MAG: DNA replication/repair protein RecF [Myxococcales bacterium]|nr:DNA replication/repair protein RecF [Myxococcota bacterium]MDW8280638.1 DNA replication/repair protein RecF [Myxococcales bacterium]